MSKNKIFYILLIGGVIFLGIITPFVPVIHIFEMFFLLVPLFLCFAVCLFVLFFGLISKNRKQKKYSLLILNVIILFISTQLLSAYSVNKFQKHRCKKLISNLEIYKIEHKCYPESLSNELNIKGIEYTLLTCEEYKLEFERGFLVREVFTNKNKIWNSYGWND